MCFATPFRAFVDDNRPKRYLTDVKAANHSYVGEPESVALTHRGVGFCQADCGIYDRDLFDEVRSPCVCCSAQNTCAHTGSSWYPPTQRADIHTPRARAYVKWNACLSWCCRAIRVSVHVLFALHDCAVGMSPVTSYSGGKESVPVL